MKKMMDAKRKKWLIANGWKIGDAKDFLGLTEEDVAYINARLAADEQRENRRKNRPAPQTQLQCRASTGR